MSIAPTAVQIQTADHRVRQRGHVLPSFPLIPLDGPGRLRTKHVLALCSISHSTLYSRQKSKTFPEPDGFDGRNFWNTETIRNFLGAKS
jgi:predicted DNA-binding transcriptional regulator AlpA